MKRRRVKVEETGWSGLNQPDTSGINIGPPSRITGEFESVANTDEQYARETIRWLLVKRKQSMIEKSDKIAYTKYLRLVKKISKLRKKLMEERKEMEEIREDLQFWC